MDLETTRSGFSSWFEHLIDAWIFFENYSLLPDHLNYSAKSQPMRGKQLGCLTLMLALWLWLLLSSQLFLSTRQYAYFLNGNSFLLTTTLTDIILSSLYSQGGKAPRKRKLTTATQGCYSATAICCLHPKPTCLTTTFSFSGLLTVVVTDKDVANSPVTLWGSTAKQHYTLACFSFLRKISLLPRLVFHLSLLSTGTKVLYHGTQFMLITLSPLFLTRFPSLCCQCLVHSKHPTAT